MSIATNHFEKLCLNPLRGMPSTAPAQVYASLYLTMPDEDGAGTEVAGGAYARQKVEFTAPAGGATISMENIETVTFPTALAPWGTVVAVGIHDSQTAGNMLHKIALPTPKDIIVDTTVSFVPGELVITATGLATTHWKIKCLNLLRGLSIDALTQTSLALYLSDPGNEGGGTEVSAADYAPQALAFRAPAEQESGHMLTDNTEMISFGRATTQWGIISHMGVMDEPYGNMLFRLSASPIVNIGISDRFTVEPGGIRLTAN